MILAKTKMDKVPDRCSECKCLIKLDNRYSAEYWCSITNDDIKESNLDKKSKNCTLIEIVDDGYRQLHVGDDRLMVVYSTKCITCRYMKNDLDTCKECKHNQYHELFPDYYCKKDDERLV